MTGKPDQQNAMACLSLPKTIYNKQPTASKLMDSNRKTPQQVSELNEFEMHGAPAILQLASGMRRTFRTKKFHIPAGNLTKYEKKLTSLLL